jgi:hypothetical protein
VSHFLLECAGQFVHLMLHTLGHSLEQRRTTRQDYVREQIVAHELLTVTPDYRVETSLMNTITCVTKLRWSKQSLSATESLVTNRDLATIWQLVILLDCLVVLLLLHGCLIITNNIAHRLFDIRDDVHLLRRAEMVTFFL